MDTLREDLTLPFEKALGTHIFQPPPIGLFFPLCCLESSGHQVTGPLRFLWGRGGRPDGPTLPVLGPAMCLSEHSTPTHLSCLIQRTFLWQPLFSLSALLESPPKCLQILLTFGPWAMSQASLQARVSLPVLLPGLQEGESQGHHRGGEELQGFCQSSHGPRQCSALWHPSKKSQGSCRTGCRKEKIKCCWQLVISVVSV